VALVEVLADAVQVGTTRYPGGPTPEGGLTAAGHAVRPVTLAERERVLAFVGGIGGERPAARARRLAQLLGEHACPSAAGLDPTLRAALDALALHLAGAALDGPLVRTTVLLRRFVGQGAETMGALAADRLAEQLGARLAADDGGWTTISFAPSAGPPAETSAAVRDQLAARLLARAALPLEDGVVAALLGDPVPTGEQVSPAAAGVAEGAAGPGTPPPAASGAARAATEPAGPVRAVGPTSRGRGGGPVHGQAVAPRALRTMDVAASGTAAPARREPSPGGPEDGADGTDSTELPGGAPAAAPEPAGRWAPRTLRGDAEQPIHAEPDRWLPTAARVPRFLHRPELPGAVARPAGTAGPAAGVRPHELPRAVRGLGAGRFPDAVPKPAVGATAWRGLGTVPAVPPVDWLDSTAEALHRVADVHGIPR
jgi:hypothetical protein